MYARLHCSDTVRLGLFSADRVVDSLLIRKLPNSVNATDNKTLARFTPCRTVDFFTEQCAHCPHCPHCSARLPGSDSASYSFLHGSPIPAVSLPAWPAYTLSGR